MPADRPTQNTGVTLTPARPGEDTVGRNMKGRVYLDDGETFEVIVRTATDETVVAKGTAAAGAGKYCSIYCTIRAEADVDEPPPEAEAEVI